MTCNFVSENVALDKMQYFMSLINYRERGTLNDTVVLPFLIFLRLLIVLTMVFCWKNWNTMVLKEFV